MFPGLDNISRAHSDFIYYWMRSFCFHCGSQTSCGPLDLRLHRPDALSGARKVEAWIPFVKREQLS